MPTSVQISDCADMKPAGQGRPVEPPSPACLLQPQVSVQRHVLGISCQVGDGSLCARLCDAAGLSLM